MDLKPEPESIEDCFREVEDALKISIPISLKNVLKINKCNNAAILRDISEGDLQEMEKFMTSETALDLIPQSEYEQFYGVFHTNPTKFKFLLGHKKLLLLISKFFKDKLQKMSAESESKQRTLSRSGCSTSDNLVFDDKQEDRDQKESA